MSIAEAQARLTAPGERLEIEEIPIRGIMTKVWKNAPPTQRDLFLNAGGFPDRIDRAKDRLIRGGENICCVEIENMLYDHPAVMDAALVSVPHKTLGEEPGAVVWLKPGRTATETA